MAATSTGNNFLGIFQGHTFTVAGWANKKLQWQDSVTKKSVLASRKQKSQWQHSEGNVAGVKLYAKKYVAMALKRRKK